MNSVRNPGGGPGCAGKPGRLAGVCVQKPMRPVSVNTLAV
jgi:hypothetical protein